MEEQKNLQQMTEEISDKLLETRYLLDILDELVNNDAKMHTIVLQSNKNIKFSFDMVEKCRTMISRV